MNRPSKSRMRTLRQEWESEENKDVVIFHRFPRHEKVPSMSPFVVKLETFFRMHDIKYKSDIEAPMNPNTQKCPWITLNGEDVTDSHIIMVYLMDKLNLIPKKALSNPEDKVLVRGIRAVLDDNLYFCGLAERYGYSTYEELSGMFPQMMPVKFLHKMIVQKVAKNLFAQAKAQGMGRHSRETIAKFADEDFETISLALGDKPFLMGDEPSEIDCTVFGYLVLGIKLVNEETEMSKAFNKYGVFKSYVERMIERFWPDYDEVCQQAAEELAKRENNKAQDECTEPTKDDETNKGDGKLEDGEKTIDDNETNN